MRLQLVDVVRQHGSHVVLDGVSLQIDPGTRLGLVGRNGSGKSTLLRILGGLEQPDSGTVVREPATLTAGYLPQEHALAAGESVRGAPRAPDRRRGGRGELARRSRGARAGPTPGALLRRARPLPRARRRRSRAARGQRARRARAAGRRSIVRSSELSGGEAARLALAAILLSRYDVLLLDEPTNDLDFDGLERLERFVATTESRSSSSRTTAPSSTAR